MDSSSVNTPLELEKEKGTSFAVLNSTFKKTKHNNRFSMYTQMQRKDFQNNGKLVALIEQRK